MPEAVTRSSHLTRRASMYPGPQRASVHRARPAAPGHSSPRRAAPRRRAPCGSGWATRRSGADTPARSCPRRRSQHDAPPHRAPPTAGRRRVGRRSSRRWTSRTAPTGPHPARGVRDRDRHGGSRHIGGSPVDHHVLAFTPHGEACLVLKTAKSSCAHTSRHGVISRCSPALRGVPVTAASRAARSRDTGRGRHRLVRAKEHPSTRHQVVVIHVDVL
jgi:hypothetical protein